MRLLAIAGLLAMSALGQNISTVELEKYLKEGKDIFFLDVREPKEIQELGSVEGYVNIPLGELEKRLNEVPKDKLIITL
jgi:rhodanese-related sulfurtransferase